MARSTQPPEGEPVVPDNEPQPPAITDQDTSDLTVAELEQEAAKRGVDPSSIDGSGKDGNVVKADLVDLVAEIPEPPAGRPPLHLVAESAAILPNPPTEG